MQSPIIQHSFSSEPPSANILAVGKIAIQVQGTKAYLYTKNEFGEVIQVGKGVENFNELLDVDLSDLQPESSFIIYRDGKFRASSQIGSLSSLTDVEIVNASDGEYLRYDEITETFQNYEPTYSLYQLLDVTVADPENEGAINAQNNKVLVYNALTNKFETRVRRNTLDELDDVDLTDVNPNASQLLTLQSDGIWKNDFLHIERDPNPKLGNDLNASGYAIANSTYRVKQVIANTPTLNLDYAEADYFVVTGVPSTLNTQCILNPIFSNLKVNSSAIMLLEIRQNTGAILIGGLENIQYEDGKPIQLSGNGKTDLITVNVSKLLTPTESNANATTTTSYVTANALNLALAGFGGVPAYRYDKSRLPQEQIFDTPDLYDPYYEYVISLLNFEPEIATGKLWFEDKANYLIDFDSEEYLESSITTNTDQIATDLYTFGLREFVSAFTTSNSTIDNALNPTVTLDGDFTIECFIQFDTALQTLEPTIPYTVFKLTNTDPDDESLTFRYQGIVDEDDQSSVFRLQINEAIFTIPNAYLAFLRGEGLFHHLAIVRQAYQYRIFVNGVRQIFNYSELGIPADPNPLTFANIYINLIAKLNSFRITKGVARYWNNFVNPNMRFGLTGGASNNVLDAQVFSFGFNLGEHNLDIEMFY